jgi:hypothetical protein
VRPDLLAVAALRSVFTEGKSLSGQRGISAGGNFVPGPVPGSPSAAGALLIELPGPRGLLYLIFFFPCWARSGVACPLSAPAAQVPRAGGTDVDVIGAGYVTSDQLKLPGSADRLAAAGGRQLAVSVFEVRLDSVDGDVHLAGDFSAAQQIRCVS